MKRKAKKRGGFAFYRTDEQIRTYMKVPALAKLKWLDNMRELIFSIKDKEFHRIMNKFREGTA